MDINNIPVHKIGEAIPTGATLSLLKQTLTEHETESDAAYTEYENTLRDIAVAKVYDEQVPDKCRNMSRILYDGNMSDAREKFYSQILGAWDKIKSGERGILILHGESGIGKTYSACWMMHEALYTIKKTDEYGKYYMSARYVTGRTLSDKYKQCESFGAHETKQSVIRKYINCDLLVLDEVARFDSAYEREAIFDIADTSEHSIIMTTNLDGRKMAEYLGPAVMDRIRSYVIKIDTDNLPSWR